MISITQKACVRESFRESDVGLTMVNSEKAFGMIHLLLLFARYILAQEV